MAERHTFRELEEWQQDQLRNTKHTHKIYILAQIQKYMRPFWMWIVCLLSELMGVILNANESMVLSWIGYVFGSLWKKIIIDILRLVVVQSLTHVPTPWTVAARLLYALLSPGVCSNSCPLSRWCYPTISPSATPSLLEPGSRRLFAKEIFWV